MKTTGLFPSEEELCRLNVTKTTPEVLMPRALVSVSGSNLHPLASTEIHV